MNKPPGLKRVRTPRGIGPRRLTNTRGAVLCRVRYHGSTVEGERERAAFLERLRAERGLTRSRPHGTVAFAPGGLWSRRRAKEISWS